MDSTANHGPIVAVNWVDQQAKWPHIADLKPNLASGSHARLSVDILIGLNAPWFHASLEECFSTEGGPIARKTPLGWVLFGEITDDTPVDNGQQSMLTLSLSEVVHKFWQLEAVGMDSQANSYLSPDEREAEAKTTLTLRHNGDRFVVGIPWLGADDSPSILKSSERYARQRLSNLHNTFQRKPGLQPQYSKVLQTYLEKGYIRKVPESKVSKAGVQQWFLPHFAIIREDKATTKVRVVFDGSAKVGGTCINDLMHTGPKPQNDLVRVLLRFCQHPVALAADMSEMFLQVELHEADRKYRRSRKASPPTTVMEVCPADRWTRLEEMGQGDCAKIQRSIQVAASATKC